MQKSEAIRVVKEAFGDGFNEKTFQIFIANLLKNYNPLDYVREGQFIREAFRHFVSKYSIIGFFKDNAGNKINILQVFLHKETSLARARTAQRNFVADYLKNNSIDAALVAFVSPIEDDWRFSLVKLEHSLDIKEGKIKTNEELSPAKRWSFLVGKNEGSHTAQSRFISLLEDDKEPNLAELEEAFNIEKVTNEFFEKYCELFLRMKEGLDFLLEKDAQLKEDFESKQISTVDFAKKTMGQMAFLYFLQKKGWFGVAPGSEWGSGTKNFLRELFKRREKYGVNFFDDVLEPLFYEALAQDRGNESIYPRLNNCRMPFLNGGLFEPMNGYAWETTNITLPDELFSNEKKYNKNEKNIILEEGDIGDGILDVFDRYNFTVHENEPLEKEVAIDPEMLGKVFENLLEIKDRKSKGAFYTPREIVHYMCQESLVNYLHTETSGTIPREDLELFIQKGALIIQNDKIVLERNKIKDSTYKFLLPESIRESAEKLDMLLANIKVCDPAVGSGAFPLGMLNEIVQARHVLGVHLKNHLTNYEFKLHSISHSIYGVDIDSGAVEIAKLRMWLALVVEEKDPHPLPNLEHKIMQGNSLLSEYEGIKLFDDSFLTDAESIEKGKNDINEKLSNLQREYFDLHSKNQLDPMRKIQLEGEIKQLQKRLNDFGKKNELSTSAIGFFDAPTKQRVAQEKTEKLQQKIEQFVSESRKTQKQNLKEEIDTLKWELIEATLEEQGRMDKIEEIRRLRRKNIRPFFIWQLEFSDVFKEKGGFDVVMGNPPWEKFKPLDPEFFSNYDEQYRELSKSKQKFKREELLKNPVIQTSYTEYLKKYEIESKSFRKDYKLQGGGDLNLYKLFLERAYQLSSGNVSFLIPGQITVDQGGKDLRKEFIQEKVLYKVIGLNNQKGIFINVDNNQKFVILLLTKKQRNDQIGVYGWVSEFDDFNNEDLIWIENDLLDKFDEYRTIYLDTSKLNFDVFKRIKLDPVSNSLESLKYQYWREYDVTNDAKYFNDASGSFILFSGKSINQYDCMAKTWLEKHGRSSRWKKVLFPKTSDFRTEYFVDIVPDRIKVHHQKNVSQFRIVVQTITGAVNNVRTLYSAILPKKYLTNNSLGNLFIGKNDEELFFYLAALNTFVVDWQVRLKVATNLNKFILDGVLVPNFEKVDEKIRGKIWGNSIRLSAVSEDFDEITEKYFGKKHGEVLVCDLEERQKLKNEIEFYFAKIWGLTKVELENILNSFPLVQQTIKSDILGFFT